jgi:hypothetical protein
VDNRIVSITNNKNIYIHNILPNSTKSFFDNCLTSSAIGIISILLISRGCMKNVLLNPKQSEKKDSLLVLFLNNRIHIKHKYNLSKSKATIT